MRRRGEDRAVAAAPADDHVGALVEQLDVGMHARPPRRCGRSPRAWRRRAPDAHRGRDRLAGLDRGAQLVLRHLGIEPAERNAGNPCLRASSWMMPTNRSTRLLRAGVAGRADDHRHAEPPRRQQHLLEIVRLPGQRAGRGVGAQRHRPDIAGPELAQIRSGSDVDADIEAAGLDRREAEMPVGADDAQCPVGGALVLVSRWSMGFIAALLNQSRRKQRVRTATDQKTLAPSLRFTTRAAPRAYSSARKLRAIRIASSHRDSSRRSPSPCPSRPGPGDNRTLIGRKQTQLCPSHASPRTGNRTPPARRLRRVCRPAHVAWAGFAERRRTRRRSASLGASWISAGVPVCSMMPSRITRMRSESTSASSWSCVT